jgi:hypothetical protein
MITMLMSQFVTTFPMISGDDHGTGWPRDARGAFGLPETPDYGHVVPGFAGVAGRDSGVARGGWMKSTL